jgi:hypothetical protein
VEKAVIDADISAGPRFVQYWLPAVDTSFVKAPWPGLTNRDIEKFDPRPRNGFFSLLVRLEKPWGSSYVVRLLYCYGAQLSNILIGSKYNTQVEGVASKIESCGGLRPATGTSRCVWASAEASCHWRLPCSNCWEPKRIASLQLLL